MRSTDRAHANKKMRDVIFIITWAYVLPATPMIISYNHNEGRMLCNIRKSSIFSIQDDVYACSMTYCEHILGSASSSRACGPATYGVAGVSMMWRAIPLYTLCTYAVHIQDYAALYVHNTTQFSAIFRKFQLMREWEDPVLYIDGIRNTSFEFS